jgi:hypothetical protein
MEPQQVARRERAPARIDDFWRACHIGEAHATSRYIQASKSERDGRLSILSRRRSLRDQTRRVVQGGLSFRFEFGTIACNEYIAVGQSLTNIPQ